MKHQPKSQAAEIRNVERMKEEELDLSDIPEVTDWSKAVVGKFHRPTKPVRSPARKVRKRVK